MMESSSRRHPLGWIALGIVAVLLLAGGVLLGARWRGDPPAEPGEMLTAESVAARILREEDVAGRLPPAPLEPGRRYLLLARPAVGYRFAGWSDGETAPGRMVVGGEGGPFEARFERE